MRGSWWNRSRVPMLTRRSALLASAMCAAGALPAAAQPTPHPPAPHPAPGGRGAKKDQAITLDRSSDDADRSGGYRPRNGPSSRTSTPARRCWTRTRTTRMPPSSMTKLMTIYLVYDRLKQGKLKLDDQLLVSEKAWRMGGSKMFVQIGTPGGVEDLIRGVIVRVRQRRLHRAGRRRSPARKSSSSR